MRKFPKMYFMAEGILNKYPAENKVIKHRIFASNNILCEESFLYLPHKYGDYVYTSIERLAELYLG